MRRDAKSIGLTTSEREGGGEMISGKEEGILPRSQALRGVGKCEAPVSPGFFPFRKNSLSLPPLCLGFAYNEPPRVSLATGPRQRLSPAASDRNPAERGVLGELDGVPPNIFEMTFKQAPGNRLHQTAPSPDSVLGDQARRRFPCAEQGRARHSVSGSLARGHRPSLLKRHRLALRRTGPAG